MGSKILRVVALVALVAALPAVSSAQFGHPLKGQWSGEFGPKDKTTRLLLDLHWDGKTITGRINPGTDTEGTIKNVTIDYSAVTSWKVVIDAEGKDASGKVVPIKVDGVLENLGAYVRAYHGTWTQAGQKSDFSVTRN